MHPRTEDLLSFRDNACDAQWQEHLAHCAECAARLERLEHTRKALRMLPMIEPAVAWSDVQARLGAASTAPTTFKRRRTQALIGLAMVASVAMVALLVGTARDEPTGSPEPKVLAASTTNSASTTVDLTRLIERSRRLDALLQTMPARRHVERVSMAATLDTMEGRIQWLDYQLAYASGDLDASQSERLWQERVELMDSLVKVRYAQARTAF